MYFHPTAMLSYFAHPGHLKATLKFPDFSSLDEVPLRNFCHYALTSRVNDNDILL